jgi:predicted DsbA family dithiol-disulfide isomerase
MPHPVLYLENLIKAAEERLSLRLAAIELNWKLQHDADERARELFASQLKEWRAEVNNVREQITNERNQFALAADVTAIKERGDTSLESLANQFGASLNSKADALSARIDPLEARVLTQTGAAENRRAATKETQWLIGVVFGIGGAVLGAVVRSLIGA